MIAYLTGPHIGIDEAGRGCLAGPVVAAAVYFPEHFDFAAQLPGLTDSKKLGADKRGTLSGLVEQYALAYGLGFSWQEEIDNINILQATFRAMSRAVIALAEKLPATGGASLPPLLPPLLIDGNKTIPEENLLPALILPLPGQYAVVDGDALIPSISAASVLAKTVRDGIMERLDALYPGYGLAQHKGYGTKEHLAALCAKGPCVLHRKTFRGVRLEERHLGLL